MNYGEESLKLHEAKRGKIAIKSKIKVRTKDVLSMVYTPGVAEPCIRISQDIKNVFKYTIKSNTVAVITDGSAVLGLGNIGAEAALPVMEGKCVLFKELAGIDAFPICIKTQDSNEIINIVKNIAPVFGGINLEDISAPRCFDIEKGLQDLGIPVMHDDQQGTAVVVLAALINSLKVINKRFEDIKVVINGAGAAGNAIAKLLLYYAKIKDITICDTKGIIYEGRNDDDKNKVALAGLTNRNLAKGTLIDAIVGADIFVGVSKPSVLTKEMVKSMNEKSIVFALSNPIPEIMPNEALEAGAAVVGTGRSDFPNQINNALGFPGIFKGALAVRATRITDEMKLAAARAIADCVESPTVKRIVPDVLDKRVVKKVASAVKKVAKKQALLEDFRIY